jgi:Zn-dependent protease
MKASIRLFRIWGIDVGLHNSLALLVALLTFLLYSQFHAKYPHWADWQAMVTAFSGAIGLCLSVVAHELAHSFVALRQGLRVRAITLFFLGGVAELEDEPVSARGLFWMAFAGPLMSFIIYVTCAGSLYAMGSLSDPNTLISEAIYWLGYINLSLAVFNLIPFYPMDGGRIFHAMAWKITADEDRSAALAARVGVVMAKIFIFGGAGLFLLRGNLNGLWFAMIGWMLCGAAKHHLMLARAAIECRGRNAVDLIDAKFGTVDGAETLTERSAYDFLKLLLNHYVLVREDCEVAGVIFPDMIAVSTNGFSSKFADLMEPVEDIPQIGCDVSAIEVYKKFIASCNPACRIAAMKDGQCLGIIFCKEVFAPLIARK